ncbi:type II toxin-antitoxin system Phd/YefM family antitoxin [Massilia sp. GCM10020059]|uniref:Type II toxin-antitoxin system prevent-host-death family antitoxin n=1 Tax=Massilia agrisoli TaxID=2892444 RepID=A0ABS8IQZ1_9BURK|nr:type II toxin-antitoxin system prevent-host-death family antitoxin [Massilia agrisoli]MCC6069679.1 type II toxin-antitoxin system prevent-host-death family antitoxin [Massilia agrisoli]
MKNVSIPEAALHLAQLVDAAACGEEVVIEKDGLPAVRLVRIEPAAKRPRRAGLLKGKFEISDDFDSPLPDDVIAGFEGR